MLDQIISVKTENSESITPEQNPGGSTVKVLHLFHQYLNTTENWIYRLISNMKSTAVFIGSSSFIRNNFNNTRFIYFQDPLDGMNLHRKKIRNRSFLKYLFLSFWHKANTLIYGSYEGQLYKHLKSHNIEILHAHFSFIGWEYLRLALKSDLPLVVSFYGFDYEYLPHKNPQWKERYKELFSKATLFICEGEHGASILINAGCDASKIKVVHLGVEPAQINFFQRLKKPGQLSLLQIASLTEKKGHIYTVKAFIKALEDCPDMRLTLVGNHIAGQDVEPELRQLIKQHHIENKVTFIYWVDFEKLHKFMHDFQVFIHPSCYSADKDCEGGAPIVLLDAQATGMPVISTFHCDIPEEVINGKTGLLSPEKDVDGIARSIRTFYNMGQEEYNRYAKEGRRHVEKNFDVTKNAAKLERIYHELKSTRLSHIRMWLGLKSSLLLDIFYI